MNPAFSEFMESSCLALAREVPEFPTQMGMFEIAGESVPQDYFTGIDAGSVARRQQLLLNIGKQLNRFSHEDLNESEQLSAGVLDFLVNYVHERGLIGRAGKDFLQHEYIGAVRLEPLDDMRLPNVHRVDVPRCDLHELLIPLCRRSASISGLRPRNAM